MDSPGERKNGARRRWSMVEREVGDRSGVVAGWSTRGGERCGGIVALEHACGGVDATVVR